LLNGREEFLKFGDFFGVFGGQVVGFAEVLFEIVKLEFGEGFKGFLSTLENPPDSGPVMSFQSPSRMAKCLRPASITMALRGFTESPFENGKEGLTVGSLSDGEGGSSEIGQGGEEIGEADGVIHGPGFFDRGGPANDEGHAVTGFPGVSFHAA